MPNHKTTELYNKKYNQYINIDSGIVELISMLWENNIDTYMYCEENPRNKKIWISFNSSIDLDKFLDILFGGLNMKQIDEEYLTLICKVFDNMKEWEFEIQPDISMPFMWNSSNISSHHYIVPYQEFIKKYGNTNSVSKIRSVCSVAFPKSYYQFVLD